eukprot:9260475-Lingulodinium_polyedra.AAC.1
MRVGGLLAVGSVETSCSSKWLSDGPVLELLVPTCAERPCGQCLVLKCVVFTKLRSRVLEANLG